ncbi:hypothetical protein SCLCIDRAFT_59378, partial [Scleroderma citrinum Foug A]
MIVSRNGIKMDPEKVNAILKWPEPTNVKQVRAFLGLGNFYRRFIKDYAIISRPMVDLTCKDVLFNFGNKERASFEALKAAFTTAPVLQYPDQDREFRLKTDASEFALGTGAVLLQMDDAGVSHPCAYLSQALVGAEQNYQVYDLELLAVIRALKAWRPYLISPPEPTIFYTDHQNITYFRQPQDLTVQQMRWHSILQEYLIRFVHISGHRNGALDLLSWMAHFVPSVTPQLTLIPNSLVDRERGGVKNLNPGSFSIKTTKISKKTPTSSTNKKRIYIPVDLRRDALREYHDVRPAGHPGVGAMMKKVLKHLWWPTIHRDIRQYVRGCQTCQASKVNTHPTAPPITPHDVASNPFPFKQVSVDLVMDLPPARGCDSILTIVDQGLTKAAFFLPTNKSASSAEIANLYHNAVYPNYGIPDAVISDRGPQFVSSFTRDLYSKSGIELKATTAYRLQSNR